MRPISEETIKYLKEGFPKDCRVELIQMDDPQAPPVGTLGTVKCVDSLGTIHVNWDNGSGLGIAWGADECRRID